ncbi:MAG: protein jag [Clostridia bacterium]|nr:protein jag [Clostridia bacterium]
MKSLIKNAKSVEEAIALALEELGATEDMVTVEVLEEGKKGFLGLNGKEASVLVTLNETEVTPEERAEDFLRHILDSMELPADLNVESGEENTISIDITGDDMGILIGRRGETLSALQYLTSLAVNRHTEEYYRIVLDTENYKKRREETLKRLAKKLAGNAVRYRRNVTMEAMSPYERRIIHSELQNDPMVTTYSTGEEPNRKVVIAYKGNR